MKDLKIFILLLMAILVVGCSVAESRSRSESLVTELEHTSLRPEPIDINISELLVDYKTVEVETESKSFHALARTDEIEKYPCSSCHDATTGNTSDSETEPHWNITLNHASSDVMTCTTCHGDDNDFDTLNTLTDAPVEFDNSYQVCAQCHDSQYDDWVGGAHGKRVEGWAEPRVIQNCVGCHNPHEPGWDKRWPAVTGGGIGE